MNASRSDRPRGKRLAIVGGGSSGLVTLKYALEFLPEWEVECFEKSGSITGVWGDPYEGFVSTSTKYTTQFSCYPEFDAIAHPDGGASRSEFFRGDEYGQYLQRFSQRFELEPHISKKCEAIRVAPTHAGEGWDVTLRRAGHEGDETKHFDAVILCTGLVAASKDITNDSRVVDARLLLKNGSTDAPRQKTIVVIGGGESAVDFANRLADPALGNRVFLSLRSGVRVSPRYHPIRGVPSDFLRNRLMLSIHPNIRNWIGGRFVAARIRYERWFKRLFPSQTRRESQLDEHASAGERRGYWSEQLRRTSKDDVFNMFHNKSDDFLDAVGDGRIQIVGPPTDDTFSEFRAFDSPEVVRVEPDVIVPAIGFRSTIADLTGDIAKVSDFHLGCVHIQEAGLFLIGFARPIIGNIPSISEMQARYVCGLLARKWQRPENIASLHAAEHAERKTRFQQLNLEHVYPVEMFPYCDRLAKAMNTGPSRSVARWWSLQTAPATTLDYQCFETAQPETRTYLPLALIAVLFALKPVDWCYKLVRRCWLVR